MKQNLLPRVEHSSRYATSYNLKKSQQNPLVALQKDTLINGDGTASADDDMHPFYASQLEQLECLIQTQRNFQNLMKTNYSALMEKYTKTVKELNRLRNEAKDPNLNKLIQDKQTLEIKFHEQVKARMVLGNMLRTVLQTLRTKNAALEQAQQQLSKCEKERDMYKEQVQKLKEQNQVLEQRIRKDRRNNEKSHSKESIYERNRSSRNSGYISHSLRTPRSLETLKTEEDRPSSLARSTGRINNVSSFTLMKHRPSLPWNLIKTDSDRSNDKVEKSPRKGPTPIPKLIRARLILYNRLNFVDEQQTSGRSGDYLQLGSICLEPHTTWNQFDTRVHEILNGYTKVIEEAASGDHFSNKLCPKNVSVSSDSHCSQQSAAKEQANLDIKETASTISCRLGQLDWTLGSPPLPSSLSVRRLQLLQGISLQDSCSNPFDLCLSLPPVSHSKPPASKLHSVNGSFGRAWIEKAQKLDQKIMLTLDPITNVSIECGLSQDWVKQYLSAVKLHKRLILVTNTAWLWTRKLLHSLTGLIMTEIHPTEKSVKRYTLTQYSALSGRDAFNLEEWLCRRNLIRCANSQSPSPVDHSDTTAILVFETMDFLRSSANRKTFSCLMGIQTDIDGKRAWSVHFKDLYLLAQSDPLSIEWLHALGVTQTKLGFVLPSKFIGSTNAQSCTSGSILVHQLLLTRPPLIDAVPMQLRLTIHKSVIDCEDRVPASNESSVSKGDTAESPPDNGEMCRWVESIWAHLYMCVKWIGLHQTQWLNLDSREQPDLLTDPFSQFASINPANDDATAGKLNWRDVASSLINTKSNEDTERHLAELLDPDIFLSFPAIASFKQEDRKPNHSEMLKWIENKWNNDFEPGLQRCITTATAIDGNGEFSGSKQPSMYIKLANPADARSRLLHALRNAPSDATSALFLRQIIMSDCPLEGAARSNFSSRLTGGEIAHSRTNHPRRFNLDLYETSILNLSENKGVRPNIRMVDELPLFQRTWTDKSRMRGKIGNGYSMENQNENLTRPVSISTTRCKKPISDISVDGRVRLLGSGDKNSENLLTKHKRGTNVNDRAEINALGLRRHLRDDENRPARFWSNSTDSCSDQAPIANVPLRERIILVRPLDNETH